MSLRDRVAAQRGGEQALAEAQARRNLEVALYKFGAGGKPPRASDYLGPIARRDEFVAWLANQVLRLASRRYRAMIKGAIALGLETAATDKKDY